MHRLGMFFSQSAASSVRPFFCMQCIDGQNLVFSVLPESAVIQIPGSVLTCNPFPIIQCFPFGICSLWDSIALLQGNGEEAVVGNIRPAIIGRRIPCSLHFNWFDGRQEVCIESRKITRTGIDKIRSSIPLVLLAPPLACRLAAVEVLPKHRGFPSAASTERACIHIETALAIGNTQVNAFVSFRQNHRFNRGEAGRTGKGADFLTEQNLVIAADICIYQLSAGGNGLC